MGDGFLDRVEDNAAVRAWAEMMQREKGNSLAEGYVSELWDFTRVSVAQNNLQELKEIWDQWNDEWVTARIKQKGDSRCIPWKNLKDLILAHLDARKKVDIFALSIYGLVVFPKIWDMLTKRSLTYLIGLIRELHQCQLSWQKPSGR
ncbi:hypothetical protein Gotur_029008 [Gossypium turneri]